VITIQLQVNKTATSKWLPVLPAKLAPEWVSKKLTPVSRNRLSRLQKTLPWKETGFGFC